jgi:hypothetical protein
MMGKPKLTVREFCVTNRNPGNACTLHPNADERRLDAMEKFEQSIGSANIGSPVN